jgi:hypothetical protein
MARKNKNDLEGGFLGSLFRTATKVAKVAAPAAKVGTTVAKRAVPSVARAATTGAKVGSTAAKAATTVSAVGEAAQKATVASRALSAANTAALGLSLGMPVWQIIEMEKQKKKDEADARAKAVEDAMYAEDAKKQKEKNEALEEKYATDYANDRIKKEADEALAEKRYNDSLLVEAERQRLQAIADEQAYADLLEQQQTALALQAHLATEQTKRLEAAVQAALSAALRGNVPANVPTPSNPSNPRPTVPAKPPAKAPAPPAKKGLYGSGLEVFNPANLSPENREQYIKFMLDRERAKAKPKPAVERIMPRNPRLPEIKPSPPRRKTFRELMEERNDRRVVPYARGSGKNMRTMDDLAADLARLGY